MTLIASVPQMLHPESCESWASHLVSFPSVVLVVRIFNGQMGFVGRVSFLIEVGLCIFGVLSSQDICQLKRARVHAIILSIRRWRLCSGSESGVLRRPPTRHAADGGYAPRFLSIFVASAFSRFDGQSTLATHRS